MISRVYSSGASCRKGAIGSLYVGGPGLQVTPIASGDIVSRGGDRKRADMARVRSGDPEAFQAVFSRYSKPILSFIYNMLGDSNRAEEATQETFIRAYRRLDTVQESTQLSTWLFGIARNVVREAIREKYRDVAKVSLDEDVSRNLTDNKSGPDDCLIAGELQRTIYKALSGLSEDCRTVFVLKVFQNMRYGEISKITGSSIGKLKTDLHRARLEIRAKLQPYLLGRISRM
jgi:RNA polymerase sigma-70 factor (ECF subfamily)